MRTHNTYIIAFCGPGGTGKSTHANLLSQILSKNGYAVRRVWIKNVHSLSFLITSVLERIDKRHVLRSTSGAIITSSIANYDALWIWVESFSIVLKVFPYLFLRRCYKLFKKKMVIVADRFILDSIIHILISVMVLRHRFEDRRRTLLKLLASYPYKILLSLSMNRSVTILLDGEEEILIGRKKKCQKYDPRWYIVLQRILYRIISKTLAIRAHYIDTTRKSVEETRREILRALKEVASI